MQLAAAAAVAGGSTQVLLANVEVAMEYLMGLTTSPYVEWLEVRRRSMLAGAEGL
jgi:L-serine deaminase